MRGIAQADGLIYTNKCENHDGSSHLWSHGMDTEKITMTHIFAHSIDKLLWQGTCGTLRMHAR
jgi:hypothetical protein